MNSVEEVASISYAQLSPPKILAAKQSIFSGMSPFAAGKGCHLASAAQQDVTRATTNLRIPI